MRNQFFTRVNHTAGESPPVKVATAQWMCKLKIRDFFPVLNNDRPVQLILQPATDFLQRHRFLLFFEKLFLPGIANCEHQATLTQRFETNSSLYLSCGKVLQMQRKMLANHIGENQARSHVGAVTQISLCPEKFLSNI